MLNEKEERLAIDSMKDIGLSGQKIDDTRAILICYHFILKLRDHGYTIIRPEETKVE